MLTNKEIIKWLQSLKSEIGKQSNQNLWHYEEALDMIIKALQEDEWIPVSERLPEKDGSYLVCMNWDYRNMDVLMWVDGWNCIRRIDGKVDRESEIDGADILAWMPLPEPYRDEYELATEQMEHDVLYEPTYNPEDGSM